MHPRWLVVVILAVGMGLLSCVGQAADEKKVRATTVKTADQYAAKDEDKAKKTAAEMPKDASVDEIMSILKLRKSKGIGVGAKPISGVADGIESMIANFEKRVPTPKILDENNADIARAAYISAAVGELIKNRCPVKKKTGNRDPEDWKKWSEDMVTQSLELAEAIKTKKAADIKAAAKKLNNTCLACHGPFKKND